MSVSSRITLDWSIEVTSPGGVGSTQTFSSGGNLHGVRPSSFKLDQREGIAGSVLEVRFPNATQFFDIWDVGNPLTAGTKIVLKVDGFTRFTGWIKKPIRKFGANDRSMTITAHDRMGMTKDATVAINEKRATLTNTFLLRRKQPGSQVFQSVTPSSPPVLGTITSVTDPGGDESNMVSVGHGLDDGDTVLISGTTEYDGVYKITKINNDNFTIAFDFVSDDSGLFVKMDLIQLWAEDFIVAVWLGQPSVDGVRVQLSEFKPAYEIGAIIFEHATVRRIGDTDADQQTLDDIEDEVWAKIVYYVEEADPNDEPTLVSNLIKAAMEQPVVDGGLGWTEGVEFVITDNTPSDILSGMRWVTDHGDGDFISFMSNLYDNPKIGLAPSYRVRDFNGNGQVQFKLVTQDNDNSIDIDVIFDADLSNPFTSLYTRIVLVNNDANRRNLMRSDTGYAPLVTDIFPTGDFPSGGVQGVTETRDAPGSSAVGVENLYDGTVKTSWGYFSISKNYPHDLILPQDKALFQVRFPSVERIESIRYNSRISFTGGDDGQPFLHDDLTGEEAIKNIYKIHQNQRITVEYNPDTDDVPDPLTWFPIHKDLYLSEVDPLAGRESFKTVSGIDVETRHLRGMINNPLFARTADTVSGGIRLLLWWMSEFIVFAQGRVLDIDGTQPTVKFTDNDADPERCLFNIADNLVDMYRPELLILAEGTGLKFRTLVLKTNDVFSFQTKVDDDPDEVALGYKLMTTRLDVESKENELRVRIDPRPDVRIGSTVHASKFDPDKYYLVKGNSLIMVGGKLGQVLFLSDKESVSGNEPSGFC